MHKYLVVSNERITPSTILLTLKKDKPEHFFGFEPGQYAAISFTHRFRPTVARCFSIVSSPKDQDILQFSMRTGGKFTSALSRVAAGQVVKVRGPFGGFVFDWGHDQKALFMAGGIGITPFMSILLYAAQIRASNAITLLYSCRNQDDIPFLNELTMLEQLNPNFKVVFVIGDGPTDKLQGKTVRTGFISPALIDEATSSDYLENSFYICGPPPFMKGMVSTLRAKKVRQSRIITEAFGQGSNRQTGKIKSWPFNIYTLGAVGLAVGSFAVMVSDVLKTIPPSSIFGTTAAVDAVSPANARQADLDSIVNGLPAFPSTGPPSDAVIAAQKAALTTASATPSAQTASSTTTQTVTAPAPVSAPVCTTSASGTRTCY